MNCKCGTKMLALGFAEVINWCPQCGRLCLLSLKETWQEPKSVSTSTKCAGDVSALDKCAGDMGAQPQSPASHAHGGLNVNGKTVVLAVCQHCNRAIAGGWYDRNEESEHREKDIQDWLKRGFRIVFPDLVAEATLEQHSDDCLLKK